ncbi:MAG: TonB-dependent receptor [Turneriella sp.]
MKLSPTTKGKLKEKLTWLIRAASVFTLVLMVNAVDAQAKGKKPPAATAAVAGPAGSVRGKILDSANGEPMIGVTAVIKDLGLFGVTDIDGNYVIANVPPGQHTVTYQITGYQSASTNVQVNPGKPARANITMNYKVSSEVVVTAKRVDNTTASLLAKQKKAAAAQDAISAEQIAKSPDSDASDAATRVTGVTILGGKNVFIRGLGERYSGVMMNGSFLPSPDPDKRVVPLDIFPTGLLDNLIVIKTHTPDLPGEFGGGLVQINSKDYPEETTAKVGIGLGYDSQATAQTFRSYDGGKLDWLGVDDGSRALPSSVGEKRVGTSNYSSSELLTMGRDFKNSYSIKEGKGLPNGNISAEFGKTYKLGETVSLGLIFTGMFRENFTNITQKYRRVNQSFADLRNMEIKKSTYSTSKGFLGSATFALGKADKLKYMGFFSDRTDDSTSDYIGYNNDRQEPTDFGAVSRERIYRLNYIQTSLLFNQLSGQHRTSFLDATFDWNVSYSRANRNEPDRREIILLDRNSNNNWSIYRPDSDITRFFQKHKEDIIDTQPSLTIPFNQWQGLKSKLVLGGTYTYRERESIARTFRFENNGAEIFLNGRSVESLLSSTSITGGLPGNETFRLLEVSASADQYTGKLSVGGGFGYLDIPLVSQLRLVAGARYENAQMDVLALDPTTGKKTGLKKNPLEEHNILPSANLIYSLTDNINLRLAFSQTLARPDFREITNFKYNPMVGSETIIGNPDLKQTNITNYDFRFEWFPQAAEIIAVSFFAKDMLKPIELLEITGVPGTYTYQFQNANKALNMGAELEFRKGLGFLWSGISSFSLLVNTAYIYSRVEVQNTALATYSSQNRALQGQSPFIVNTGIDHNWESLGLASTLLFNISGRRIIRVGTVYSGTPIGDVYEEPYLRMDFVLRKKVFEKGQFKLAFGNILNPEIRTTQEIQNSSTKEKREFDIDSYRAGMTISGTYTQQF